MTDIDVNLIAAIQENMTVTVRVLRQREWGWRCRIAFAILEVAVWIIDKIVRPFKTVLEMDGGS